MMSGPNLRALALLGVAALLGGCNTLVSKTPVFASADSAGAPLIHPGLWVSEKPNCTVDEASPVDKWPACAEPLLITPTELRGLGGANRGQVVPYLLANGDPLAIQLNVRMDYAAMSGAAGTGGQDPSGFETMDALGFDKVAPYFFMGIHPLALDRQGRIVRMEQWQALCGPVPPPAKPGDPPAPNNYITHQPLPGLKVKGQVCVPEDKRAVLDAARETRAYSQVQTSHWVRDTAP